MLFAAAFLPASIHALQAMGRAYAGMPGELDERIALLESGLLASATGIGQLKLQVARLRLEELLFDQAQAAPEADRFATIKPA
ncbi:hypothetical protein ACU4GI_22575 [Cupriavidus basilensis]